MRIWIVLMCLLTLAAGAEPKPSSTPRPSKPNCKTRPTQTSDGVPIRWTTPSGKDRPTQTADGVPIRWTDDKKATTTSDGVPIRYQKPVNDPRRGRRIWKKEVRPPYPP